MCTLISGVPASMSEIVSLSMRLVATSSASLQWCRSKTHQYLSSMSVSNFLLISQTDLKVTTVLEPHIFTTSKM